MGKGSDEIAQPPRIFASYILANKPMAHLAPRWVCVVAGGTFPWMECSYYHLRIWLMILGRIRMMMWRCSTHIQEISWRLKQGSDNLNGTFNGGVSCSHKTLKLSGYELLVSLPFTSKELLVMRTWLGYGSTVTFWILQLWALWPIKSAGAAAQLQISHWEDGMHWLDGCLMICVVGGYLSGTLEGGRMGDNLEFFWEVLGPYLVFCLF